MEEEVVVVLAVEAPETVTNVSLGANSALLYGYYATISVGNSYTGGISNLGFTMNILTTHGRTLSFTTVIGNGCFSINKAIAYNTALASTKFVTLYNLALNELVLETKWTHPSTLSSTYLHTRFITILQYEMAASSGSSFSTGTCLGTVPITPAQYY